MVGIAPQVQPILGNPNFELDIELTRDRGNILTKDAAKAKATSAIASGITTAIDNFYDIRSTQAELDQRKENLESSRLRNRAAQRQEERDVAVQQAQLEIDQLNKSKEKANAVIAAELAKSSGEAYDLGSSQDPVKRLQLLTDPKYAQFRAANARYIKDIADRMYSEGDPKTRSLLDNLFYKKNEQERQRQASVSSLKRLDREISKIDTAFNSTGLPAYVGTQEFKNGRAIIGEDGKPDVIIGSTKLSDILGDAEGADKLRLKGAALAKRYEEMGDARTTALYTASGKDTGALQQRVAARSIWRDSYRDLAKQLTGNPLQDGAIKEKMDALIKIKDTPEALLQQKRTPAPSTEPISTEQTVQTPDAQTQQSTGFTNQFTGEPVTLSSGEKQALVSTYGEDRVNAVLDNPKTIKAYEKFSRTTKAVPISVFIRHALDLAEAKKKGS